MRLTSQRQRAAERSPVAFVYSRSVFGRPRKCHPCPRAVPAKAPCVSVGLLESFSAFRAATIGSRSAPELKKRSHRPRVCDTMPKACEKSALFTEWKIPSPPPWSTASIPCASKAFTRSTSTSAASKWPSPRGYRVIVDRISHDIAFYRAYLKNAALNGTQHHQQSFLVGRRRQIFQLRAGLENRRRRSAHRSAAAQSASARNHAQSMRNLIYPLNWDEIFEYIGFPAFLKPLQRRRLEERL